MGEAMLEDGVFVHAKARALLEVVRLAFEGGNGFETEFPSLSCITTQGDVEEQPSSDGPLRLKPKQGREITQHPGHPPHRSASTGSSSRLVPGGPCMWCGVTATPQWRRPRGTNKLLCNACGIFFTRYGRLPERMHHAHVPAGQAAADSGAAAATAAVAPLTPSSAANAFTSTDAAADNKALPAQGAASSTPALRPRDHSSPPAADTAGKDEPTDHSQAQLALQQRLQQQQQQQQLPPAPSPQLPQRTGSSPSRGLGISPFKRKAALQLEAELLHCSEDCRGGSAFMDSDTAAPAVPPVSAAVAVPTLQPTVALAALAGHQRQTFGLMLHSPVAAAAAAAVAAGTGVMPAVSTELSVAPLGLGIQQINEMRHLGLLGPSLAGLGTLPYVAYLPGPPIASSSPSPSAVPVAGSSSASAAAAAAAVARVLGFRGLLQTHGQSHVTAAPVLPAELPQRSPFPPSSAGRLPGCGALLLDAAAEAIAAAPPPPDTRPAKRQERLPVGESDDSNVSTDSHAATHGDTGMTSYDEDEGGTTTTGITVTTTPPTAAGASPSTGTEGLRGGLSCSPPAWPAGLHLPPAKLACSLAAAAAVPSLPLLPRASAVGVVPEASAVSSLCQQAQLQRKLTLEAQLLQQRQQIILLQARRSKGPRSRAASVTPSSSTQS